MKVLFVTHTHFKIFVVKLANCINKKKKLNEMLLLFSLLEKKNPNRKFKHRRRKISVFTENKLREIKHCVELQPNHTNSNRKK